MRRRMQRGFSLVELMVALVFTSFLMAGLARVYKSSLASFHTGAERLSTQRRGRIAVDMISDDLNAAGMYLFNILQYPTAIESTRTGFWVTPNQTVTLSDGSIKADRLYFYMDQALPFQGTVSGGSGGVAVAGVAEFEGSGKEVKDSNLSFSVDTGSASFASMVKPGQRLILQDGWPGFEIAQVAASGTIVTITPKENYQDASGAPTGGNYLSKGRHRSGAPVTFMNVAQLVRYSIQSRAMDPGDPTQTTPCLVRDQGSYDPNSAEGFAATTDSQVLAEDVSGLRTFFSVDGGKTWVTSTTDWTDFKGQVASALAAGAGRQGFLNLSDPSWYRDIPILVRLDITTRTPMKRADYDSTGGSLQYRELVQTLILKPRHFGLTFR